MVRGCAASSRRDRCGTCQAPVGRWGATNHRIIHRASDGGLIQGRSGCPRLWGDPAAKRPGGRHGPPPAPVRSVRDGRDLSGVDGRERHPSPLAVALLGAVPREEPLQQSPPVSGISLGRRTTDGATRRTASLGPPEPKTSNMRRKPRAPVNDGTLIIVALPRFWATAGMGLALARMRRTMNETSQQNRGHGGGDECRRVGGLWRFPCPVDLCPVASRTSRSQGADGVV